MKYKIQLLLLTILMSLSSFAQTANLWTNMNELELLRVSDIKNRTFPTSSTYYRLDLEIMTKLLFTAPNIQSQDSNVTIQIPNMNGEIETFKVWESSNFAPELQAAFPNIRAYTGKGLTDRSAYIRISLAPNGIQTMVLRADKKAEFMEPYTIGGSVYALFNSTEKNPNEPTFNCFTKDEKNLATTLTGKAVLSNAQSLKKIRLALSCTGEYAAYFGGTVQGALAGMNATLTRVNGIFEKDLAVRLELISNNSSLIYTNASTDPYSDASVGAGTNNTWSTELQSNLDNTIGFSNYDMGHLFGATGGGGNSGCIGCICSGSDSTTKGSAFTSPSNDKPEGDDFDIDFAIHEMGHQLGANHTYSFQNDGTAVQIEPGSGSTIMGYAGITKYDIQKHSDPYFTYRSIDQIQTNLNTRTCQTSSLANTPPTVNAGASYTVPKSTPFLLSGTGTDADGDTILYTWEQNDNSSTTGSASLASGTKTSGPNFRSILPGAAPTRYMPALYTILSSTASTPTETPYEALSSVARTLNFVLTGRDNHTGGGQTNSSAMTITVDGTKGPLSLSSLNSDGINWTPGSTQTITWAVNSTNSIAGASNVDILLSTDNGNTFNTVLKSNVPNNGSASVTVPSITATNCRLMVKATANVFFAINRNSFSIGYTVTTTCPSNLKNSTVTTIPSGTTTFSTSSINVSNSGTVKSLSVSVDITHSNLGELSLILVSPSGKEVKLITDLCSGSSSKAGSPITFTDSGLIINCAIVTGNVLPEEHLYNLLGQTATGTWKLKFRDDQTGNSGTLNSWTLNLCIQNAVLGNEEFKLDGLSLYPNPVNEILNISVEDSNLPDNFIIYNSLGQTILNRKVNSFSDLSIDTSGLSGGVYFIRINKDLIPKTLRFLKK